jgi:hypothetical protein
MEWMATLSNVIFNLLGSFVEVARPPNYPWVLPTHFLSSVLAKTIIKGLGAEKHRKCKDLTRQILMFQ